MNSKKLNGFFAGCVASLICYFLLIAVFSSQSLTVTSNVKNGHPSGINWKRPGESGLIFHSDTHHSPPNIRKEALLSVVPTSWASLEFIMGHEEEWKRQYWEDKLVLIGGTAEEYVHFIKANKSLHLHLARECSDFSSLSSNSWWSPSQLICILENIYIHFLLQYDWFAILSNRTYLATRQLKRILKKMESWSVTYMGHPHPAGHCIEGAVVISREALEKIVRQFRNCLNYTDLKGDIFLARCFVKTLKTSCYEFDKAENYFIDKKTTSLINEDLIQPSSSFTSVYPVDTDIQMKTLYQTDLIRELRYNLDRAKRLQEALTSSPKCKSKNYVPKSKPSLKTYKHVHWSSFDPPFTFTDHLQPSSWFDGNVKMEIETVARRALTQYCHDNNISLTFAKASYGMHRYLGIQGKEYMVDVITKERITIRLHLLRYHNLNPIVLQDSNPLFLQKTVNFVVPLSNVRTRFREFMETYDRVCLQVQEQCKLHLVVYGNKDLDSIKETIKKYRQKYPSAAFNVIPTNGTFSRGRALHIGISTLQAKDLLFMCDVDMTLERNFLNRCRQNAIQGQRIYYPEVFKYYNMDYVYKFEKKPTITYQINRYHGHWCTYGYGMVCMHKSDYVRIGGYNLSIVGWGGEDIKLADKALKSGYDVMRAPDPALSHRYHPKVCPSYLSKGQYTQCIASRNEDIADKRRLADYVQYLENQCNVKKNS